MQTREGRPKADLREGRARLKIGASAIALAFLFVTSMGTALGAPDAERAADSSAAPLPPARPAELDSPAAGSQGQSTAPRSEPDPDPCLERLTARGIKVEALPAISDGACQAVRPFKLKSVGGAVLLAPEATLQCAVAEALAAWASEVVVDEARRHLGSALKAIHIGTSYQCRPRNQQADAQLSEHAFANAVDVMGFAFDQAPAIVVGAQIPDGPAFRFLAAIRQRACAHFTTVLGPGSDPYHHDHLHLDLRLRRGNVRLCQ